MLAMLWMSVAAFSQITISQEDYDKLPSETVPVEKFEEEFKFSLQDLTNWWNKKVLKLQ